MNSCYLHLLLAFATVATAISAAYEDDVGASIDITYEGAQSIATEDTRTLAGNNWEENDDEENDNNKIHRATGWVENIVSDEFPTVDADGNNIKRGGHKKFTVFHLLDNKDNKGLAEGYADKFLSLYSVTEKSAMLLNANNDAFFNEDFATGSLISLEYRIPSAYAADTNKNERRSFQHERYDTKNAFQVVSYDILYDARDRDNEDEAGNAQKARGVGKRGEYSLGTLYVSHRRLLVIIGNFKGYDPISCTVDDLHNTVFGMDENSVVSYFHNRTNGIYDFTRDARGNGNKDVVGPYTIQIDKRRGCDSGTWASDLIEAARNDGVNVEYYQHRMLIIPKTEVNNKPPLSIFVLFCLYSLFLLLFFLKLCSWDGLGTVGCSLSCNTWIPHCANSKVMEHELGHNLGLDHEGSLLNEINSFVEYGDPTGIMGNKWWSSDGADDIVAPHMVQLGAIWGALTVSAAGTYEISPLDIRPESAEHSQTMRVRSSVNGRYYYFSYRVGQNFNLGHKILVQRFRSTYYPTEFIGSFDVGETFMDVNDVFGVRVVSITNASAVLEVTFGCTKAPPALELFVRNPAWKGDSNFGRIGLTDPAAPVQMWWNNKRKVWTTSVVVRVTDNNSPNCFETQYVLGTEFNVSGASGSGLVVAYDAKSATIRSGTSCDLAVTFETKTKGAYPMIITATGRDAAVNVTLNLNAPESCVRQLHVVVPVRQNTSEDDNADADGAKYAEYPRAKRVVNVSHFYDYYDGPLTMSFTVVNTNPSSCGEGDGAFTFATAEFDDDIFRGDDSDDNDYESDEFYNNSNGCGDLFSIEGAFSHSGSKSWSSTMLTVTATLNNNSLSNIGTTCTAYAKVCNKKDSALCTGLMLNLHLVEGCYRTMPKISIGRFTYISARSSIGIPVIIEDGAEKPRSCKYTLSIVDKDVPSSVTSSVLDPVIVTKKSVATTRVVFNGRDELGAHEDITSLIAIQEFEGKTGPNVTFVTEEAVCVKGAPRVSYSCSNTLVDEGAKEVKFYCHVYISNTDSWFCKNTTFMINRVEDPRLNITYERESVNVFPGDTESIDIDFLYNASDEIEETAFKFDFEINDTEGLELHGKKDTVIKEIGPCVYDNPTIEIGDDDSQSGFNEREYKYIARITNNNNMFCKSVSFKVTLNSSSFENISFSYPTSIVISSLETRVNKHIITYKYSHI